MKARGGGHEGGGGEGMQLAAGGGIMHLEGGSMHACVCGGGSFFYIQHICC